MDGSLGMNKKQLKELIEQSLKKQGFRIRDGSIVPPANLTKQRVRKMHEVAVAHKIESAKAGLQRFEDRLLNRIASGTEVDVGRISPKLVEVESRSDDELLFRYACLHWSIPVSSGYGRRLRFLVIDQHNDKLIGVIGLGDPVFALRGRDQWIGWDAAARIRNLRNVMDAFALGAVPPYSALLCSKFVAMVAASEEVSRAFRRKYAGQQSLIGKRPADARLALITTTSALGRSSVYNRLKYQDRTLFCPAGYTSGSGEFHFSNGLYGEISKYATRYCIPTAKQEGWGNGFRNRREVIKKCLPKIGLSGDWLYHGIGREIFVVPLASNARQFLRGENRRLLRYGTSVSDLFDFFRNRWLFPRSERDKLYLDWDPEAWRLW
jgi:hypothetical protein